MSGGVFGDGKPVTFWRLKWRRLRSAFAYPRRMSSTIAPCPLCSGDGVVWQFDRLRAWDCSCAAQGIETATPPRRETGLARKGESPVVAISDDAPKGGRHDQG